VPTEEGIIEALTVMKAVPVDSLGLLNQHLNLRAGDTEKKSQLKARLLKVAMVAIVEGRKCMVLKPDKSEKAEKP
jgi:hypothetical protein